MALKLNRRASALLQKSCLEICAVRGISKETCEQNCNAKRFKNFKGAELYIRKEDGLTRGIQFPLERDTEEEKTHDKNAADDFPQILRCTLVNPYRFRSECFSEMSKKYQDCLSVNPQDYKDKCSHLIKNIDGICRQYPVKTIHDTKAVLD